MHDAEMCHLASSGRAQGWWCCGGAESTQSTAWLTTKQTFFFSLLTLDLIIDDSPMRGPDQFTRRRRILVQNVFPALQQPSALLPQ